MDVQQITMDPAHAARLWADYDEAIKRNEAGRLAMSEHEKNEYLAARQGYDALSKGTPLIMLSRAIADSPRDAKKRPMLAVGRADRAQVCVRTYRDEVVYDCRAGRRGNRTERSWPGRRLIIDQYPSLVRRARLETSLDTWSSGVTGFALVPLIPAHIRKSIRAKLSSLYVLWEVEEWSDTRIGSRPDHDPILLSHLGGDAYAVVAHWDLTELERAVMQGRASV